MIPLNCKNKPVVFITMGDPSGIGPEVIMKAMASPRIRGLAVFVLIGDRKVLKRAAEGLFDGKLSVCGAGMEGVVPDGETVNVIDTGPGDKVFEPGISTAEGAAASLASLRLSADLMRDVQSHKGTALVTGPLSKEKIAELCPGFVGHTEFLQAAFSVPFVTMAFVGEKLSVVPVTRHVPIKEVASCLTGELVKNTIRQVIENRKVLCGRDEALIGVSGLNPHNGENGRIGTEEIDIIHPAVEAIKNEYPRIEGPIPADVIFHKALNGQVDLVVAMYHDQCLSAFKMVEFETGVNMTLGLGRIRTSPDHGTAFDIAGKGIADPGSMINAIKLAVKAASACGC